MNIIGYEAICTKCDESFNPVDEFDLIHVLSFDEEECGGEGVMVGAWGTP
jgi:hypothetical protein